jgi:hypothetical protein
MKDGLYLHVESIEYESDYHSVSEITGQATTHYSWVKDQDLAVRFIDWYEANTYLAKLPRKPFFRNAEVR